MRHLSFINKIIFAFNILIALLLLVDCLSPYVSVTTISFLPFLALGTPILVIVNVMFLGYWVLKGRRQFILSLIALVCGYLSLGTFIQFNNENNSSKDDLKIMSYNVRQFNSNLNLESKTVFEDIKDLVATSGADIVCFQEASNKYKMKPFDYPYKYISEKPRGQVRTGISIFSKYPIIEAETILFTESVNNGCYADILVSKDTIRVYNLHMQSLGITPGHGIIRNSDSQKLYKKLTSKFYKQETQAEIIAKHSKDVSYRTIITGDFNNNQYSRTYNILKGDRLDSFDEKGSGYGRTFNFHRMPVRIDFMLADPGIEITSHKNFNQVYSDHFPILATFRL
ncbi:endonuclease/exonuclease/phosphatase family protein [Aurantibacter sp.]|uniref:endonuclease/exonuclease/phosphatase family protein n=1 Tax=Aurantibacter sp. TaxID=2807103 RepID=UPI0032673572